MEEVILILGASSEVGCRYLREYGDRYSLIYAHYNHINDELSDIATMYKDKMVLIQADLNDVGNEAAITEKIEKTGIWPNRILHCVSPNVKNVRFSKVEWNEFEDNLNVMVGSCVKLLPHIFKQIIKNKSNGQCVFVLSSCTEGLPPKFETPYVTSKYAMLGLMKALSVEYAARGIMINGVSPGMMETKFLGEIIDHVVEENALNSPFGRNLEVGEVTPMIDFLLSEKANRITGQNIIVSGGMNNGN